MSFMDQFKKYINADSNYDDYDDYDEAEDVVEDTTSYADESYFNRRNSAKTTKTSRSTATEKSEPKANFKSSDNVIQFHSTAKFNLKIIQPTKYSMQELNEIAELLEDNFLIFLDLGKINGSVSTRFVDFCCGFARGIKGCCKKISNTTYVVSPYDVEISGDLVDTLGDNNNFNF